MSDQSLWAKVATVTFGGDKASKGMGAKFQRAIVCVYYCSIYFKVVRMCVGGKQWRTCATRDYEQRPV
jgi:hypothetical protein